MNRRIFLNSLLPVSAMAADWRLPKLPQPYHTPSATNRPKVIARPDGAQLEVPQGFHVDEFAASGFEKPRFMLAGPSGEVLVSDSVARSTMITLVSELQPPAVATTIFVPGRVMSTNRCVRLVVPSQFVVVIPPLIVQHGGRFVSCATPGYGTAVTTRFVSGALVGTAHTTQVGGSLVSGVPRSGYKLPTVKTVSVALSLHPSPANSAAAAVMV